MESIGGKIQREYIRGFVLGGKCECAIVDNNRGIKVNYIVKANKTETMYFVYVKTKEDSVYAGFLRKGDAGYYTYSQGNKGTIPYKDARIQNLIYAVNYADHLPDYVEVWHMGRCSRCNRKLTDPVSIERGLGPECAKKI